MVSQVCFAHTERVTMSLPPRRKLLARCATVALAAVAVAACGPHDVPAADPGPDLQQEADPVTGHAESGAPAEVIDSAVQDLRQRLGVERDAIVVVEASRVTWRDGSLGCPRPGLLYTQALREGYRLVLQAGGTTYEYHAGEAGAAFLCETPDPAGPVPFEDPRS
jgi:hypothetical protein